MNRKHSFLCPNGTIFSQQLLTCDWWYNVDCQTSAKFYNAGPNAEVFKTKEVVNPSYKTLFHRKNQNPVTVKSHGKSIYRTKPSKLTSNSFFHRLRQPYSKSHEPEIQVTTYRPHVSAFEPPYKTGFIPPSNYGDYKPKVSYPQSLLSLLSSHQGIKTSTPRPILTSTLSATVTHFDHPPAYPFLNKLSIKPSKAPSLPPPPRVFKNVIYSHPSRGKTS